MLTDTQVQVLAATNDHCEVHGRMNVGTGEAPLPDLLADLEMPEQEVRQALADLHELGLIKGTPAFAARHPIIVTGLRATGQAGAALVRRERCGLGCHVAPAYLAPCSVVTGLAPRSVQVIGAPRPALCGREEMRAVGRVGGRPVS